MIRTVDGVNAHLDRISQLARRISRATDDNAAHLMETIHGEVSLGRTVVIARNVGRSDVAIVAAQLHDIGAGDLHYAGRWTSNEHGLVPHATAVPAA